MTPERWQKVKEILDGVSELNGAEREEYLVIACDGDNDLRKEVESFLHFENRDEFEDPSFSFAAQHESFITSVSYTGKQIGNYLIVGELGSGGMGAVFLAERADGAFEQRVALKLIKRGMDSDVVLQRFFNERRILAALKHPNIARLIDGGTTDDGVPYFVMEYVEGNALLDYAEQMQLSLEDRLNLFLQICSAVSFAHQNLVIHRDLKPSNILVTSNGRPKLLDFGIAKVLESGTGRQTATHQFALTPEYASPEQMRGEKLTTATDVYSLGVILYELLTAARPFKTDGKNFGEIMKLVIESEPARPSAMENATRTINPRALAGDLDNVILKALRKEPASRYSSVDQLASDIERHLKGLPVSASRDTFRYRLSKFASRNRYGVASAGLILLVLTSGLAATLYQANIAQREKARAEHRFDDVRRLANSIMLEISDKIDESPIKARELLAVRAVEYLDKLAQETGNDPQIQLELATAYEKIGDVQSKLFDPSLGRSNDALASQQKALQLRESIYEKDKRLQIGLDIVRSRLLVGDLFTVIGNIAAAQQYYSDSIQLGENLLSQNPENFTAKTSIARAYSRLGQSILRSGSLSVALANYQKALAIYLRLADERPDDPMRMRRISIMYSYIGYVHLQMLKIDEATNYFRREFDIEKEMAAASDSDSESNSNLIDAQFWLGVSHREAGDLDASLSYLNDARVTHLSRIAADPENLGEKNAIADCYFEIGQSLTAKKAYDDAIKYYKLAQENYDAQLVNDSDNPTTHRQIAMTRRQMAAALGHKGETKKAIAIYNEVINKFQELIGKDTQNTEWQDDLALSKLGLGITLQKSGDNGQAQENFKVAVTIFQNLSQRSPENERIKQDLSKTLSYLE